MRPLNNATTIVSGTVTEAIAIRGRFLSRLFIPAALASTAISFEVSTDGAVFVPATATNGSAYTITVSTTALGIPIPPEITRGAGYIRVKTGSTETNKTFTLVLEEI
jgi:hypothetical protein